MRAARRLLYASPVTTGSSSAGPLRQAPLALLPPIPLYRRILRAHRKRLHPDERVFGDQYVKSEFRLHKDVENPMHIIGFLTEWQLYAQKLEGDAWKGEKMDKGKLDKMSDEQVNQLYELMQAIQKTNADGDEDPDTGLPNSGRN